MGRKWAEARTRRDQQAAIDAGFEKRHEAAPVELVSDVEKKESAAEGASTPRRSAAALAVAA